MPTRRSRRMAAIQAFGIIGLILSALLAIAIVLGVGWATDQVDGAFGSVNGTIERGATIVDTASGKLEERAADIDAFLADAAAAAGSATVPQALAERASAIADRYQEVRDDFVALRARVESAYMTIAQIGRFLPALDLPTEPPAQLVELDARIAEFDGAVAGLRGDATATVDRIVEAATSMRSTVDRVTGVTASIATGIDDVQARVAAANDTIDGYLQLVTIVMLALVGYIAALNLLIVLLARRRPTP